MLKPRMRGWGICIVFEQVIRVFDNNSYPQSLISSCIRVICSDQPKKAHNIVTMLDLMFKNALAYS